MSRTPDAADDGATFEDGAGASDAIVRFEGVGMRYGRSPEVLQDVSFELMPGSFHFLTGPSGAGKSSLLKLIYLAHRPSRGRTLAASRRRRRRSTPRRAAARTPRPRSAVASL